MAGGAIGACNHEIPLPKISWSSDDFSFATEDIFPFCGGTLNYQQEFVDLAQDLLGPPPPGKRFTYYHVRYDIFEQECLPQFAGCYKDGQIFAKLVPDHHEVTHAVVDLGIGRSHPFFSEGIAEIFRDGTWSSQSPGGSSIEDALGFDGVHEALPPERYGRAGHFMSYLLAVHGTEATLDLLTRARPGDTVAELKVDMEASLGLDFSEIMADYAAYPECKSTVFRWPITECTRPPIDEGSDGWHIQADVDCSRSDVIGPRLAERSTFRTIEVSEPGMYAITVAPSAAYKVFVELGHCSVGCADDKGLELAAGTTTPVLLRKGRYQLTFVTVGEESERVAIEIKPLTLASP